MAHLQSHHTSCASARVEALARSRHSSLGKTPLVIFFVVRSTWGQRLGKDALKVQVPVSPDLAKPADFTSGSLIC